MREARLVGGRRKGHRLKCQLPADYSVSPTDSWDDTVSFSSARKLSRCPWLHEVYSTQSTAIKV